MRAAILLLLTPLVVDATGGLVGCPGCPLEVNELTESDQTIVDFAMAQLESGSNNFYARKVVKVTDFKRQVVAGIKYIFTLQLADTECPKTEQLTTCEAPETPKESCTVSVWQRVWLNSTIFNWDDVRCEGRERREAELHRVPLTRGAINLKLPTKLGGDGHDMQKHGKHLLGADGHDMRKHGKPLLGGDGHDIKKHGKPLLGGDGHDMKQHGKPLLGGDGHDMKQHGNPLLGADDHDMKHHENLHHVTLTRDDSNVKIAHGKHVLGGDDHDKKFHGKHLLGRDGHDKKAHRKYLLGGDEHDKKKHGKHLLGGDDHDRKSHKNLFLGGERTGPLFDEKPHHKNLLGSGNHDYQNHGIKKLKSKEESHRELKKLQSLSHFHMFMKNHAKKYASKEEYKYRYGVFRDNMKKVQFLTESELGTATYGATHLADLTEEEFKRDYLGVNLKKDDPDIHWPPADIPDIELEPEFDWRTKGAVTPVQNQGMCGSCWAFSVTGNVEGQWAARTGQLLKLSEQELVDCDKRDDGCNGGLPENAYQTILELGGLDLESEYVYDGKDETCVFNKSSVAVSVTGGLEISQNETKMAQWLVKNGPISVGLNANAMQFYFGGVSHPWKFLCSAESIDHGVLIVGYGMHETSILHRRIPYWIIKNSWGPSWGEQGYYRLYRGDGTCGINMMTSSAIVGPPPTTTTTKTTSTTTITTTSTTTTTTIQPETTT